MPILQFSFHSVFNYYFVFLFFLLTFLTLHPPGRWPISFPFLFLLLHCSPVLLLLLFYHLLSVTSNSIPSLSLFSTLPHWFPSTPSCPLAACLVHYVCCLPRISLDLLYRPLFVLDWRFQILVSLGCGYCRGDPDAINHITVFIYSSISCSPKLNTFHLCSLSAVK